MSSSARAVSGTSRAGPATAGTTKRDYEADEGDEDDRGVPADELVDQTLGVLAAQVDRL